MGDPMYRFVRQLGANNSLRYRESVRVIFEKRGYKASIRAPQSADADLLYMVNAQYLLPGRGGFSTIATHCMHRYNEFIFERVFQKLL